MTLSLERSSPEEDDHDRQFLAKHKVTSGPFSWKLKWFSEESFSKFVSLLEAIHSESSTRSIRKRFFT